MTYETRVIARDVKERFKLRNHSVNIIFPFRVRCNILLRNALFFIGDVGATSMLRSYVTGVSGCKIAHGWQRIVEQVKKEKKRKEKKERKEERKREIEERRKKRLRNG